MSRLPVLPIRFVLKDTVIPAKAEMTNSPYLISISKGILA